MKKLFIAVIVSLGLAAVLPVSTFADSPNVHVTGKATNNTSVVKHASVTITCNGHTKTDYTHNNGGYDVKFKTENCPLGSVITVTATKNGLTATGQGIAASHTFINLAFGTAEALPEMGTVTSVAGLGVAMGAFMVVRRRQTNAS